MTDPQSLEEAWELVAEAGNPIVAATPDGQFVGLHTAARALALVAFEMGVNTKTPCGHTWNSEHDERRRIEALGK